MHLTVGLKGPSGVATLQAVAHFPDHESAFGLENRARQRRTARQKRRLGVFGVARERFDHR
jgi:hypothetical protein